MNDVGISELVRYRLGYRIARLKVDPTVSFDARVNSFEMVSLSNAFRSQGRGIIVGRPRANRQLDETRLWW